MSTTGIYWRYKNCNNIYWSESPKDINHYIKFNNPNEYFKHRENNGFPKNWSNIITLEKDENDNEISKKNKCNLDNSNVIKNTYELHKIRITDYNNINNSYLPYKCDWNYANHKLIGNKDIQPKTIFIKVEFIESFYNSYYKYLHKDSKFIIISGGGDVTIPENIDNRFDSCALIKNNKNIIFKILKDPRLIHWYAENCSKLYYKLTGIPTGIMNNSYITSIYNKNLLSNERIQFNDLSVICCHRTRNWNKERIKVNNLCKNKLSKFVTFKYSIPSNDYCKEISKYTFVLCVEGGGLDPSPKAFEAIIAGSIPIIKYSEGIFSAYSNLPVVFVNDWNENELCEYKLSLWLENLRCYYENIDLRKETLYKLSDKYWWNYITNSLKNIDL